ncbi:hypothetical protein LK08_23730 [Streptomyces sp. MUSC 125]|uniref:hypothetical protein n=1 Tax=Streptomyces sp. MUSC 125 TaxID=1428624 RepID=UPI00057DFBBB|nr:hypothetical protein [Streptomyces sp. MUSC 125]KIE24624.1 hypothetical protein LK08_23730 [Streptomyces sp. MUSC 125]
MTIRPATRRLFAWTVPPLGLGALALAAKSSGGLPVWVVVLGGAIGGGVSTVARALPALLPQKSEHRRDVWRDWLHHRERMARLRITATASGDRRPLRASAAVDNDTDDDRGGLLPAA